MKLNFIRQWSSILGSVSTAELGDFIVLSGPNGSGKTHLLEAIEQGAVQVDGIPPGPAPTIRLFRLAQLVAVAEAAVPAANYRDAWVQVATAFENARNQLIGPPNNIPRGSAQLDDVLYQTLVNGRQITKVGIEKICREAGRRVSELTEDDFRKHGPLVTGVRDPFQLSVGELFLTYQGRRDRNQFYQWQAATKGKAARSPVPDEEFNARYGPPPWELLNETLRLVGLPYEFNHPEGIEDNLQFQPMLFDSFAGLSVRTDQLSSGEKTLLAVAMSLYMGSSMVEAIELPSVLLLDESDASLHPSMVQSLLQVAEEVFVGRYGVKVILTTHSPSTVALAPEDTLYIMRRSGNPRLKKASRDEAVGALTVGLSTLSVKIENRRQAFVESEYDEQCYQELFRLIRHRLTTEFSIEFIASGKGGQGNSAAVKHLVTSLREAGNQTVFGIIDRDTNAAAPEGVVVLEERYSIENLVLDPLIVGAFLLREKIVEPATMGVAQISRHFELTAATSQAVINAVTSALAAPGDDQTPVTVEYLGGFSASVPHWYLNLPGHDLEDRLCAQWPQLRGYGSGLKLQVIRRGFGDLLDFVPKGILDLLAEIIELPDVVRADGSSAEPGESDAC